MSIACPGSCELKGFGPNPSRNSARSNQVWAGDITNVWTTEGWLYLAARLTGALTMQALANCPRIP